MSEHHVTYDELIEKLDRRVSALEKLNKPAVPAPAPLPPKPFVPAPPVPVKPIVTTIP